MFWFIVMGDNANKGGNNNFFIFKLFSLGNNLPQGSSMKRICWNVKFLPAAVISQALRYQTENSGTNVALPAILR
jgi:hypothetical protein